MCVCVCVCVCVCACVCVCVREAGGSYTPLVVLNNSEMVKAVTLVFGSIQNLFIRNIRTKYGILNSSQSPDFGENPDGCITDFRISG